MPQACNSARKSADLPPRENMASIASARSRSTEICEFAAGCQASKCWRAAANSSGVVPCDFGREAVGFVFFKVDINISVGVVLPQKYCAATTKNGNRAGHCFWLLPFPYLKFPCNCECGKTSNQSALEPTISKNKLQKDPCRVDE